MDNYKDIGTKIFPWGSGHSQVLLATSRSFPGLQLGWGGGEEFTLTGAQNGMARIQVAFFDALDRVLSLDKIALK